MVKEGKVISNKEFEDALANKDNARLINHITNQYAKLLTKDVRKTCGLFALWRALQSYDPSFGQKFTSSLYRFVHWECRRELANQGNVQRKHSLKSAVSSDDLASIENKEFLNHFIELLPANNRSILKAYYFDNLSLVDIGRVNGYTKETARKRVKEAVEKLKEIVNNSDYVNV